MTNTKIELLRKAWKVYSSYSAWLKIIMLHFVSWLLCQLFSLLISLGIAKNKRAFSTSSSGNSDKSVVHQTLLHHSIKRKTNWEMRKTLVSAPAESIPTLDCGALLLGAVLIFYLSKKRKLDRSSLSYKRGTSWLVMEYIF